MPQNLGCLIIKLAGKPQAGGKTKRCIEEKEPERRGGDVPADVVHERRAAAAVEVDVVVGRVEGARLVVPDGLGLHGLEPRREDPDRLLLRLGAHHVQRRLLNTAFFLRKKEKLVGSKFRNLTKTYLYYYDCCV
jgi:hypothetical protein